MAAEPFDLRTCSEEAQLLLLAGGYPFLEGTPCHSDSKCRALITEAVYLLRSIRDLTTLSNLTRLSQQGFNLPSPLRNIKGFQGLLNTRLAQLLLLINIGCEQQQRPWGTLYPPGSRLVPVHQLRTSSHSIYRLFPLLSGYSIRGAKRFIFLMKYHCALPAVVLIQTANCPKSHRAKQRSL